MRPMQTLVPVAALAALLATVPAAATAAGGAFVEEVDVIRTLQGAEPGALFGWEVNPLADVDRDGVTELIVGEPAANGFRGATYVFSGASGERLRRFEGDVPGDLEGYAVADAGDTDGDGVHDVVTGAPGFLRATPAPGRVRLYSGATGALLHTFAGFHPGDRFGLDATGAGDLDGDGRGDLLVGAPTNDAGGASSGRAWVYSGRKHTLLFKLDAGHHGELVGTGVGSIADVSGDGIRDLIVGARNAGPGGRGRTYVFSGHNGRPLFTLEPPETGVDFGWFFTTGVGDQNADGVPDVYVADFNDAAEGPATGRVGIYSGRDGSEIRSFVGAAANEGLGPGRGAGDVDGDGIEDLAIGSYTSSAGAEGAGRVELFSGADGSRLRTITSLTPGEQLGFDTIGFDDLNRDGVPELIGAAANGDRVYVIAGERD